MREPDLPRQQDVRGRLERGPEAEAAAACDGDRGLQNAKHHILTRGSDELMDHEKQTSVDARPKLPVWETPRILSREPIEAVASTCTGGPAKAILGPCTAPLSS